MSNSCIKNDISETQSSLSSSVKDDDDTNVWQQIQQLAKNKRSQQLDANPPKRQGRKPSGGRGGGRGGRRANVGRKKSIPKVSYWIYKYVSVLLEAAFHESYTRSKKGRHSCIPLVEAIKTKFTAF